MLVTVTTATQFESALNYWISESDSEERRIVKKVFDQFMASNEAKIFHTVTGLVCFNGPHWQLVFNRWRDGEITRKPQNLDTIHYWTLRVSNLIQSDWMINNKLIVTECLQQSDDFSGKVTADLFDALIVSG
jgi:hypothetical protein